MVDESKESTTVVKLGRNNVSSTLSPREIEIERAREALKPATAEQIATVLAGLAAIYGAPEGWEFGSRLYLEALSDLPLIVLQKAANAYVRTNKWFPKPSEVRELARDDMYYLRSDLDTALEDPDWPKWLERLYGPKPEGPRKRAEWFNQGGKSSEDA